MSDSPNDLNGPEGQISAGFPGSHHNGSAVLLDDRDSSDEHGLVVHLEVAFQSYDVRQLTQYGFFTESTLPEEDSGHIFQGKLISSGEALMEIEFRVRRREEGFTKCTFCNLSLEHKKTLLQLLDTMRRPHGEENALAGLSYDQLASGSGTASDKNAQEKPAGAKKSAKTMVVLALGLGMLGIVVLSVGFMHMQYSLSVTNAALVGNYLPINTKIDGEIAQVLFTEGDEVRQGDVLLRLSNPIVESVAALRQAELEAAHTEVAAYEQQLKDFQTKLEVVSQKLSLQLKTAKAELRQAKQNLNIASAEVDRFAPFVKTGAITQVEFDQARSGKLAFQAQCEAKQAQILSVELSQLAMKHSILVMGDRIDNPRSKLLADLKIAEAEVKRLQVEVHYAKQQEKQLEILAPRDGAVYASYRQVGEYLKPADEALALSTLGRTWAMGQISASQVSKVRPGQVVRVVIPALDIKTTGVVSSVGHRAVYAKGGYNADFRSGVATDVPIKVALDALPAGVPSGIRLDMTVKLELGIPWLDDYLGNTPPPTDIVSIDSPATPDSETTLTSKVVQTAVTSQLDEPYAIRRTQP